jgi:hypothetical protein
VAGDVAAVLDGEAPFGSEAARPGDEPLASAPVGRHGELGDELAGSGFEGDHGVALLVRVDAEYHHGCPLSDASSEVRDRRWTGLSGGL